MAGFSSALLTRKAFLGGSAKVSRDTNGAKTFALFKKAEKKVKQATQPAKKNVKQAQKKVVVSDSSYIHIRSLLACGPSVNISMGYRHGSTKAGHKVGCLFAGEQG